MTYRTRQLLLGALAANAIRPVGGLRAGIGSFVAGWLTGELAPQLLTVSAADTAQLVARGRASKADLVVGAAVAGTYGWLLKEAWGAGASVETALGAGIGADYADRLDARPTRRDLATPWREVARPFHLRRREVERITDVAYTRGGVKANLDIYRPSDIQPGAQLPVLVQVHGGAWVLGSKESQGQVLMNRMASRGWVCVAVNYRLAPKHRWPTQIVDVKRALGWVKTHIGEYGGDPAHVAITGGSAGGHLASLAALTPGDPAFQPGFEEADTSVVACVPFYGVYDLAGLTGTRAAKGMRDGFLAKRVFPKPYRDDPDSYRAASPLDRITADAPDFFVIHGSKDTVVPVAQAQAFVEALRDLSQATVTYAELAGAQHAFETFSSVRSQHVVRAVERWLEWHRATHPDARAPRASA